MPTTFHRVKLCGCTIVEQEADGLFTSTPELICVLHGGTEPYAGTHEEFVECKHMMLSYEKTRLIEEIEKKKKAREADAKKSAEFRVKEKEIGGLEDEIEKLKKQLAEESVTATPQ